MTVMQEGEMEREEGCRSGKGGLEFLLLDRRLEDLEATEEEDFFFSIWVSQTRIQNIVIFFVWV